MKGLIQFMCATLMLSGCSDYHGTPVDAYQRSSDRIAIMTGLAAIHAVWPCMRKEKVVGVAAMYATLPDDQCYRMDSPQHWQGIWRLSEHESFCPGNGAARAGGCASGLEIKSTDVARVTGTALGTRLGSGLYWVEFVGRRTKVKGAYPGLPAYDRIYVVDHLIGIKRVGSVAQSEVPKPGEPLD